MPTDICEQLRKRAMYVPFVFEAKDGNLDREAADTIESLRAEVSRLSAELEGARKATIEEMAQIADEAKDMRDRLFEESGVSMNAQRAAQAEEIAAAIRQKGETP